MTAGRGASSGGCSDRTLALGAAGRVLRILVLVFGGETREWVHRVHALVRVNKVNKDFAIIAPLDDRDATWRAGLVGEFNLAQTVRRLALLARRNEIVDLVWIGYSLLCCACHRSRCRKCSE